KFLTSGRLQSLTQREIDVAIRVTQTPEETLVGRSVYAMEFQVFASPELTRSTKDYRKLPWVIWHEAARATLAEQWVAENLPTGCICGRVVSAVSMMDLVQAGVGAAILPRKHALLAGLEPLSPVLEEFTTPVWVLTHRDLASSARVRAVTDHIYRVLRDFGREDGA
ncbi:MAG: substrate-binding domain-containing protein, partial [Myxococcota bacterium]